jgi:hypothetical protein
MRLILALAAGTLGFLYVTGRRATDRRRGAREEIARWEGEGGNPVAATAGAMPPADPAGSPFPAADPAVRH